MEGPLTSSAAEEKEGNCARPSTSSSSPPPSPTFAASSSQSAASSSSSSSSLYNRQKRSRGLRLWRRRRRKDESSALGSGGEDDIRDLALPLGMSFAAVVARVLDRKIIDGEKVEAGRLSTICSLAVREAVEDVYGNRFDKFMGNFQKSFSSTLKTLQTIKEETHEEQPTFPSQLRQEVNVFDPPCDQIVVGRQLTRPLSRPRSGFDQSTLTTLERSVVEQARSNDLKALEIGLTMEKLKLKKSELYLSSYASFLERVKISMSVAKSAFQEEKFKSKIQDTRHGDLVKTCLDLLIAGLILMCGLLLYGAYTFSFKRISEATQSCNSVSKEPKQWWIPKQVSSFNSGFLSLRCQVVVISRMCFGVLMILSVAYSAFLRSSSTGTAMPVTFIIIILGAICGAAGKFCVDTLGGSGNCWLFYWETLCLLHFMVNAFPGIIYWVLHGPVIITVHDRRIVMPYWIRKSAFFGTLVLVLPVLSGLIPFASLSEWEDHLVSKLWSLLDGEED
ncbi:CPR5 protein [Wolffia australiana]